MDGLFEKWGIDPVTREGLEGGSVEVLREGAVAGKGSGEGQGQKQGQERGNGFIQGQNRG